MTPQSDASASAAEPSGRSGVATDSSSSSSGRGNRNYPSQQIQVAEIEEVDVNSVWPRDGQGFTNWLSANLDRLAKELGIGGLREVGRDVQVGTFTVDLLAQTDKGRRVAIEYQLEPSDHPHLGQVITFAAGLDVSAVIWLVTRISDEHRGVLDWLNQHSDDDTRFFAVELRLIRIGGSTPAATFRVESRPNDWQKVVRQRQRVGSPLSARMREF